MGHRFIWSEGTERQNREAGLQNGRQVYECYGRREVKGKVDKVEIRLNAIESMLESVELGVEKTIIAILYNVEIKKV
jgi:hypothetical protein